MCFVLFFVLFFIPHVATTTAERAVQQPQRRKCNLFRVSDSCGCERLGRNGTDSMSPHGRSNPVRAFISYPRLLPLQNTANVDHVRIVCLVEHEDKPQMIFVLIM